ncbi:MBL fold metallo-hydrolase [Streptomyces sp. NPDC005708]|uniref:MBL fold metallo-hydrolase n=1 Tax=Streptomyces sp. NPDC005708 TaxID=3154564 RepID=UPI0033EE72DA
MSGLRIERVVTTGVFELDGGTWDVDNNVWLIGDDSEVVIIDAAHDEKPIVEAVGDRNVLAVVCTHGHNDHVTFAPKIGEHVCAPVLLHPGDQELWEMTHPGESFRRVTDAERIAVAGTALKVIHTPGHSPGSICLHLPEAKSLFSGDTLFAGGPGATGRSFSDFPTIIDSIRDRLFTLPEDTRVYTGHGDGTTISTEAPHLAQWIKRGH